MHENPSFFENKSEFFKETHMVLCSASRVQRILSIQISFEGITRVFEELSSIIYKISCSVGEMHENRGFFKIKSVILKETHLCSDCIVNQILSNEDRIEGITRVFKELSTIIPKISCSVGEMYDHRRFFEN